MLATYVCKCLDGEKREFVGSVEESVNSLRDQASAKLGVTVVDLIDEIRNCGTMDVEDGDGDDTPVEGKISEGETPVEGDEWKTPTAEVNLLPGPGSWKDDSWRRTRKSLPAIYIVACPGGSKTVRGTLDEPMANIAKRAKGIHHIAILGVEEEICLED